MAEVGPSFSVRIWFSMGMICEATTGKLPFSKKHSWREKKSPRSRSSTQTKWNIFQNSNEQLSKYIQNLSQHIFASRSWIISISLNPCSLHRKSFDSPPESSWVSTITKAFFPSPCRKQVNATKVAESHMGKDRSTKSCVMHTVTQTGRSSFGKMAISDGREQKSKSQIT